MAVRCRGHNGLKHNVNMKVACLVDSSKRTEYEDFRNSMLSSFNSFGIPHEMIDLAKGDPSTQYLEPHSALFIGQHHLGESLSMRDTESIIGAIWEGAGLVCFDGDVHRYKDPFKDAFGLRTTEEPTHMPHLSTEMVRIWDNAHYITSTKELDFVRFNKPVEVGNIVNVEREHEILAVIANNSGCPALITEAYGKGKVVISSLSPKIWLDDYLGHFGGLDDIFWKSIVWVARKPFVTLSMLPFVTIRIDDCSGAGNFKWVRILNEHGFMPHVSLFTENIGKRGARAIKRLYDGGLAEFSVHAFTWNKQTYWKPKSPSDHSEGREFSEGELGRFFEELDEVQDRWGIKWSKVLTAHFGEVGKESVPFLKKRGITYLAIPYDFGQPYGVSALQLPRNRLRDLRPFDGKGGIIDRHPDDPDLFIASPSYYNVPDAMLKMLTEKGAITPEGQTYDFLWETARTKVDIELAAWYAAFGIKLCLDGLSFAVLVTHEQNIAVLNDREWDQLLSRVDALTSKYEKIYKSWSHIAEYAKNLSASNLTHADYDPMTQKASCHLEGKSSMPLYIHVFRDMGGRIERDYERVPPYEGSCSIVFRIGKSHRKGALMS